MLLKCAEVTDYFQKIGIITNSNLKKKFLNILITIGSFIDFLFIVYMYSGAKSVEQFEFSDLQNIR